MRGLYWRFFLAGSIEDRSHFADIGSFSIEVSLVPCAWHPEGVGSQGRADRLIIESPRCWLARTPRATEDGVNERDIRKGLLQMKP